jgi:hypothetical protein
MDKAGRDNRADQLNPNNPNFQVRLVVGWLGASPIRAEPWKGEVAAAAAAVHYHHLAAFTNTPCRSFQAAPGHSSIFLRAALHSECLR